MASGLTAPLLLTPNCSPRPWDGVPACGWRSHKPKLYWYLLLFPCGHDMFMLVLVVWSIFRTTDRGKSLTWTIEVGLGFTGQGTWVPRCPGGGPDVEREAQPPGCMVSWTHTLLALYFPFHAHPERGVWICVLKPIAPKLLRFSLFVAKLIPALSRRVAVSINLFNFMIYENTCGINAPAVCCLMGFLPWALPVISRRGLSQELLMTWCFPKKFSLPSFSCSSIDLFLECFKITKN